MGTASTSKNEERKPKRSKSDEEDPQPNVSRNGSG